MRLDIGALRSAHEENRRRGALATIAVYDPSLHLYTGIAGGHLTLDEDRVIERFEEGTPPSGEGEYVNTGRSEERRVGKECRAGWERWEDRSRMEKSDDGG